MRFGFIVAACMAASLLQASATAPVKKVKRTGRSVTGRKVGARKLRTPPISRRAHHAVAPAPYAEARSTVHAVRPALRGAALEKVSAEMSGARGHFEGEPALGPFLSLLSSLRAAPQPVHILQFGDSHTASDDWVDAMRQTLQAHYGNGGPGFGMAGHPFRGYRRFDLQGGASDGWRTEGTVGHPGDGRAGLSGISITAESAGQTVHAIAAAESIEMYFLQQPGGGSFQAEIDGAAVETMSTDGALASGFYQFPPQTGQHVYAIRTLTNAPVRLFGWVADNPSGVTWETMGINGAQASMMLDWDEALWAQQIQRRNPALVVLAYGTNEANSRSFEPETYRRNLLALLARVRRAVPNAGILMVGPPDCGRLRPLTHLDEVIALEREVAQQSNVAFWDWRRQMGGPRSTLTWVRAGLGQTDSIHLTGAGYRLLGREIAGELDLEAQRSPGLEQVRESER